MENGVSVITRMLRLYKFTIFCAILEICIYLIITVLHGGVHVIVHRPHIKVGII